MVLSRLVRKYLRLQAMRLPPCILRIYPERDTVTRFRIGWKIAAKKDGSENFVINLSKNPPRPLNLLNFRHNAHGHFIFGRQINFRILNLKVRALCNIPTFPMYSRRKSLKKHLQNSDGRNSNKLRIFQKDHQELQQYCISSEAKVIQHSAS